MLVLNVPNMNYSSIYSQCSDYDGRRVVIVHIVDYMREEMVSSNDFSLC